MITGIVSVQIGSGLAGRMFGEVSPATLTVLRLWTAAIALAAFGGRGLGRSIRGLIRERAWPDAAVVVAFGVTLAIMNFAFYQAIARIPLGIAVTIEFLGPLAVAVASSRRLVDLAWVALAGGGVALLSDGWSSLSVHGGRSGTALAGVACALVAAAGWAAYILLSASTGRRFPGSSGLAIALMIAAVAVTPTAAVGAAGRGGPADPLRLAVLGTGVAAGLLSSVIPYRLELETLRRIPARIFGIWMSLEPAIAALVGLLLLGQSLAPREWAAIGCVIVACAGAARGDGTASPAPPSPG